MLKRAAFVLIALAASMAWPASACQKCKMALVCQPNCEIQEYCTANTFNERGFECEDTIWGCQIGSQCYWVENGLASTPLQLASSAPVCSLPGRG